mgnify:CR=1 FL=1|tara:strand:- start:143 stop:1258 length:1116 start_codon:yes stop_codon:yes gene_type:complete
MNITLKRTTEQLELVKAMASKNRTVAYEAQVALAEFIGPVISEVINNAPTLSNMFTTLQFNPDDNPSIPLDLYYDVTDEDYVQVWSQSVPGGLPTNHVTPTHSELKFATYTLDTAVSFEKRYAARSRLDVVGKTFTRVAQEVLLKQERTSANLILGTLADASTNNMTHAIKAITAGNLTMADFNQLLTRSKRVNTSWIGGTPDRRGNGITDLVLSPELMQEIRAIAYNPQNSVGTNSDIPATDEVRDGVWRSAGMAEFFGVNLMEINEFGVGQRFNTIFDTLAGATTYDKPDDSTSSAFNGNAEQIALGVDLVKGRDSMLRAVALDEDSNSELQLVADDQYSIRQKKIGYFGQVEEGRMVVDDRVILGLIV